MMGVMVITMLKNMSSGTVPEPTQFLNILYIFPLLLVVMVGIHFGWYWSVAIELQHKIPDHAKLKTGKFKVFLFIPLVYILSISIVIGNVVSNMSGIMESGEQINPGAVFGWMAVIFPLHLFSMFCIFYCMYFVAKTFKTAELQRETTFSDFVSEFFLIWFYPIGIWIIQPKINRVAEDTPNLSATNP